MISKLIPWSCSFEMANLRRNVFKPAIFLALLFTGARPTQAQTLTTLYSFTNGTDGSYPYAGVTMDSSGNLYGAATGGGQYGWGTIFEIVP